MMLPETATSSTVHQGDHIGWRRFRLPLFVILVPSLMKIALVLVHRFEVVPEVIFPLTIAFQLTALLAGMLLLLWFFLASGYTRRVRLIGAGLVAGIVAMLFALIRSVEFDGQMTPLVNFRWEPDPAVVLAEHLTRAGPPRGNADLSVGDNDSPAFRGRNGDGVYPDAGLARSWPPLPRIRWKQPVGGGHSGIAVAGNAAITLEQRGEYETIVCYDRDSGAQRWHFSYPARFQHSEPMGGDGPRTTPVIVDGTVISLGATGELVCLDGATGNKIWQTNILQDNGAKNLEWGLAASPLVLGSLLIVTPGIDPRNNRGQAVAAYDRLTGEKRWANGRYPAAYASPMRVVLGGLEQVLVFDGAGLGGYHPADGSELWRYPWVSDMGMNSAQPLWLGDNRLFVSSEKANGCALIEVRLEPTGVWEVRELWKTRALAARFSNMVSHGGMVYGLSDGRLTCVDLATGQRRWRDGNYGNGQIILTGSLLLITAESGDVALVAADPDRWHELGRMTVFSHRTWNVPALAGRHLFLRNHREMACLELPTDKE